MDLLLRLFPFERNYWISLANHSYQNLEALAQAAEILFNIPFRVELIHQYSPLGGTRPVYFWRHAYFLFLRRVVPQLTTG